MKSNLKSLCHSIVNHALGLHPDIRQIVFSALMKFRDGEIHISQLVSIANMAFNGHDHLSKSFESILPLPPLPLPPNNIKEDSIRDTEDSTDDIIEAISRKRKKSATFSEDDVFEIRSAIDLCKRVQMSFNDDFGICMSFFDAVRTCYDKNDDHKAAAIEVEKEFKFHFKDHPGLQIELHSLISEFDYISDEHERKKVESIKRGGRRDDELDHEYSYNTPLNHHPCQKMLFEIEDDQSNFHVALSHLESTRVKMERLVEKVKLQERRINIPIILEDYELSDINLRCIEVLYGMTEKDEGYGQEVIEQLRKNPIKTGEVVLRRLCQKEKEIGKAFEKFKTIWRKARKDCHERWKRDELCSRSLSPESAPEEEGKEQHRRRDELARTFDDNEEKF